VISLPFGEPGDGVTRPTPEIPSSVPGARILVVDDEENLRGLLHDVLSGAGHHVDEAATAREALGQIEQQDYDLIALDLRLPDMHGSEVWRRILERDHETASRVGFITGGTMRPDAHAFLADAG